MRIKNIIYTISFLSSLIGFSQNNSFNDSYQKFQKAFPKMPLAPTTYSFIRRGEVPISEYTGTLGYNINLYNVSLKDLNIPLTLSYVGGNGIKVNEEASWVGLGWSLTLPTISQVVNDFDDLNISREFSRPDFFSTSPYPGLLFQPNPLGVNDFSFHASPSISVANPTRSNGVYISLNHYSYYNGQPTRNEEISTFTNDSEPDYFTLSLFGENIKFISKINSNNQIYFEALNKLSYKIERTSNNNFKITDDKGIIYFFDNKEEVFTSSATTVVNRNWMLTKIEIDKNIVAEFKYDNYFIKNLLELSQRFNKTISLVQPTFQTSMCFQHTILSTLNYTESTSTYSIDNFTTSLNGSTVNSDYSYTHQNYLVLKEIDFSDGKIFFNTSDREDSSMRKLNQIIVKNYNDETVKNIVFDYDYFSSDLTNYSCYSSLPFNSFYGVNLNIPETYLTKRLKLKSLNNFEDKPYLFEYNSTLLPPKCTFAKDYWGYSNGKFNNSSLIPNPIHFTGKEYLGSNGNDLRANLEFCKSAILNQITYPSGGKTVFEYELNQANNFFYDYLNNNVESGNGLRIKSISNLNFNNSVISKKQYNYFGGKSQNSKSFFKERNFSYSRFNLYNQIKDQVGLVTVEANSSITSPCFENNFNVGYDKVEISDVDVSNISNGKIEKIFFNQPSSEFKVLGYDFNMPSINSQINQNGNEIERKYYDAANNIVKREEFVYNYYLSNIDYGVKVSSIGFMTGYTPCADWVINPMCSFIWCDASIYGCYPIYSFETNLAQKKEIIYSGSDTLETITNLAYNNKRLLTSESTQNSDLTVFSKQNFYSFERLSNPFMAELLNINNNYTEIVESNAYRNGILLYNFKNNYSKDLSTSNLIKTKEVLSKKGQNDFEIIATYDNYDSNGNITQYTLVNGMTTSIIWGYKKSLPIAKIENASLSQIASALGISTTDLNNLNETNLNTLNSLRTNSNLNGAMITTYSHIPLIGVQTITDVRGDTTHYTYDSLNRLKNVKDKDLNILNEYKYHFKN